MATPSHISRDGTHSGRRQRLPSPAIIVSGAALAAAGLWLSRTPIAENWARAAMAERGVDFDMQIRRLDFGGVEATNLRIGNEKTPAIIVDRAVMRFNWRAPWAVEAASVDLTGAHFIIRLKDEGVDLQGVEKLFAKPAQQPAKSGGGFKVHKFTAKDASITLETKFGPISALGRAGGDLAGKSYAANFAVSPAKLRGPGFAGLITGGKINASVKGERLTIGGTLSGNAAEFAHAGIGAVVINLAGQADGLGSARPLSGTLNIDANGSNLHSFGETSEAALFNLSVEKNNGPIDRINWKADFTGLGGDWLKAPAATFAGGYSGRLPGDTTAEGRGGWSFTSSDGALTEPARNLLRNALMGGQWPDPIKAPFGATAQSLLRAGEGFDISASGDLQLSADGMAVRAQRADLVATSGARAIVESAPNAAAIGFGPRGMAGQGSLTLAGGGTPPLTIQLKQLTSSKDGWSAQADLTIAPWQADGVALAMNVADLQIQSRANAGDLAMQLQATYSGPIGGGVADDLSLKVPANLNWGKGFWRLTSTECPQVSTQSWRGAGLVTGAFSGALCPVGGIIAAAQNGTISGRSDWKNVSIPARLGDKANAPSILIAADAAMIDLQGSSKAPKTSITAPDITVDVTTRSDKDGREQVTRLAAETFGLDLTPAVGGMLLDVLAQGATADLDGTTLEIVDGSLKLSGAMAPDGLNAQITDVTALVRDPGASPLVTDLRVLGQGEATNGKMVINMVAQPVAGGPNLADIKVTHDLKTGQGKAVADTGTMRFTPGRQPQALFPLLQGKIADVRGRASGLAEARWGERGFSTNGELELDALDFATFSLGPVTGVSGKVRFDNLLDISTPPHQSLRAKMLNPGVLVEDTEIRFDLLSAESMQIEGGQAKVVGGRVLVEPVTWHFGPDRQEFALMVEEAPIEEILKLFKNPSLKGTGVLHGRIPMALENGRMRVEHARLEAVGAGVIQVTVPAASQATANNKIAKLAFDALKDLQFNVLAVDVDGDVDGRLENKLYIQGKSPKVSNLPFVYNIGLSAQILPLIQQARYIYDKSAIGDYTRALDAAPLKIDATPAPKE